jgi:gas vesicle protein
VPFEIASALIGLGGVVIGGAISSVTTLLINRNERKKFRIDRSWDLRREAYTAIIGALDRARAILDHIDEGYREEPHAYDESEASKNASKQMIEQFHLARMAFHANRLMLSKAFASKYDKLNTELDAASSPNLAPPEKAAIASEIATRIVAELEELALIELGVGI